MTTKHTPVPWKVDYGQKHLDKPHCISTVHGHVPILRWGSFARPSTEEAKDNATLIVRAVNVHETLVGSSHSATER